MRLFGGAQHSFDRGTAIEDIPEARVALGASTTYIADDGAMLHPLATSPGFDPGRPRRDGLRHEGGRRGARIGSRPGDAALFREDMVAFWMRVLGRRLHS